MINRLKKLWKWRYRQGVISIKDGNIHIAHIKFDGVYVVLGSSYGRSRVELRKQDDFDDEPIAQIQVGGKNNIQVIN